MSDHINPNPEQWLKEIGESIKKARLRRNMTAEFVAKHAGISRQTMYNIEKGSPSVSIGAYAAVLHLFQMGEELAEVVERDPEGFRIQNLTLSLRKRASRRKKNEDE